MSKKSKIVIARIMTMLMVLSVLPFDLFTTAGVVMAQESAEADLVLDNDMGETDVDNIVDIGGPESIGGIQETEPEENTSEEANTPAVSEGESVEGGTQEGEEPVAVPVEDEETAEPSESDEADVSNAGESEAKTYILDPETEAEYTSPKEDGAKTVGTENYFSLMYTSSKGVSISTFADITTNIKDGNTVVEANKKCYDPLLWGTYANDTLGTKATADRTKCVRLVGGAMAVGQNCIKIRTTLPNAKLTVYSSPKAALNDASAKIEVKKLSGTSFAKSPVYAGTDTVNPNVAKDVITLADAGEYCIGFSKGGGIILYMEVTEGETSQGGDNSDPGDDSTSTIEVDETTSSIVSSVELGSATTFKYADGSEGAPSEIVFKAEEMTENDTKITVAIKTAVATAVGNDDAEISYYDMTLVEKGTDKAVTLETGTVKFKMPYPTGVTNKNRITVLHEENTLVSSKVKKEADGFIVEADGFSPYTVIIKEAAGEGQVSLTEEAGYEEGAYAEWEPYDGADGYKAYYSTSANGTFKQLDNELIREYKDYWRADAVGLAAGTYYIKVEAYKATGGTTADGKKELELLGEATTGALTVTNYDRSGFAFAPASQSVAGVSSFGTGSGAYNDDGTLKSGAQVIYVTAATAKTCKAMIHTGGTNKAPVEVTGLQAILTAKQKKETEKDILDIRIIGCVTRSNLDSIASSEEGLQIKGRSAYNEMNITLEGIGEDAVVKDFGFLIRNCCNVEFRNFAIMAFMDDGVSLDTANKNIWVHDLDIFYGSTGGDSDQAKGDGSFDVKAKSTFITASYNHFWDSGKCSLCGMSDSEEFTVTYHHNWFDHSDSRHPRIRVGSIHVYNNYFDGNSKYGVGVTKGSSAFVEANYFRNCKYPMLISQQASDLAGDGTGTFSGEDGGIIKAYNNTVVGARALVYANATNGTTAANPTAFDAYLAANRTDTVPDTYKTVKGGTSYNNFDTTYNLGVTAAKVDDPAQVPNIVMSKAGRLNGGDFSREGYSALNGSAADENYSVDSTLKSAVVNYKTSVVTIGGIDGVKTASGSGSGSGTGDNGDPDDPPKPSTGGIYVHNFTDGVASDEFFKIEGKAQGSPTSFAYTDVTGNNLTLSGAIKMESSTSISFTAPGSGKLIIVTKPDSSARTKIDGERNTPVDGIIEKYLESGPHAITKQDQEDIYYIVFILDEYDADDVSAPIASMASGDVPKGTSITLQCATEGAKIYYTTDGTEPTASSTPYTDGAEISLGNEERTVVIKAIAIKGEADDAAESIVVTYTYTVSDAGTENPDPPTEETYTVKLDAGAGQLPAGTQALVTASAGQSITLGECTPPEGQKFVGWALNGNEDDLIVPPYIVNAADAGEDNTITLKAIYASQDDTTVRYTVTLDTNGGTLVNGGGLVRKIKENETINPGACEKTGWVFKGWKVDGEIVPMPYKVTKDVTLTAEYEADEGGSSRKGIFIIGLEEEYQYTGAKIIPDIGIMDYNIDGGKLLTPGVDYTVKYKNNTKATDSNTPANKMPTLTVTGKGNYASTKIVETFKITAVTNAASLEDLKDLKGAKIETIAPVTYTGTAQYPDIALKLKGQTTAVTYAYSATDKLYKEKDKENGEAIPALVAVSNNVNKGTATILLTGKAPEGKTKPTTLKKTFKITAIDLKAASDNNKIEVVVSDATYTVKGAVPKSITVKYDGKTLKNGTDYTAKYSSNKKAGENAAKVTITGKGNYTRNITKTYSIGKLKMSELKVNAVKAYDGLKAGKVTATVLDKDGNALKPSQYTLVVKDAAGQVLSDTLNTETTPKIYVSAEAKDTTNLEEGSTPAAVFDVGINIASAKFVLKKINGKAFSKQYTGNEITISSTDFETPTIKVKGKAENLTAGTDYDIVKCSNNINKGTATAIIVGKGKYSGTKTVKFKIVGQEVQQFTGGLKWDDIKNDIKGFMNGIFN